VDISCYLRGGQGFSPLDLLARGASELNDQELLAAVLEDSPGGADPCEVAASLLDGSPAATLRRMSSRKLRALAGPERAARLLAALELGRRALTGVGATALSSPRHVQEYARPYATAPKEHFLTIHLNARHVPLLLDVVSVGTLSASLVHPREVFRRAIRECAAAVAFVHNHPSGDPTPSSHDREITSRLADVSKLLGIRLLDHVVVGDTSYVSFVEQGWL